MSRRILTAVLLLFACALAAAPQANMVEECAAY